MRVVKAETLLTVHGTVGELAKIALHLGIDSSEGELFIQIENLDDDKKEWLEGQMEINGLHDMMSILFEIIEEVA